MSVKDASWIVIEDSRVMLQIVASLTYYSRGNIYNHSMFIALLCTKTNRLKVGNCDNFFYLQIQLSNVSLNFPEIREGLNTY